MEHLLSATQDTNTAVSGGDMGVNFMNIVEGAAANIAAQYLIDKKSLLNFNRIAMSLGEGVLFEIGVKPFMFDLGGDILNRAMYGAGKALTAYGVDYVMSKRKKVNHYIKIAATTEGLLYGWDMVKNSDIGAKFRSS